MSWRGDAFLAGRTVGCTDGVHVNLGHIITEGDQVTPVNAQVGSDVADRSKIGLLRDFVIGKHR